MSKTRKRAPEPMEKLEQRELSILQLIHSGANNSRLELARLADLSPSSITAIVQRLLAKGLVIESEPTTSQMGRRPIPLQVRKDAAYLLGVDLGSFFLRIVITDINGEIVFRSQARTDMKVGRERVLEKTFLSIHQAIRESNIPQRLIKGIGIGHSGVIDSAAGVVLSYPRPGQMEEWRNVPLRAIFEKEFSLPCLLEDSVRTSTIAEKSFGAAKELSDFLYIDVGMGIGAGIFLDGKIYRGAGGRAGEFGHITVNEDGPLCSCGNTGCLETLASSAAIIQDVRAALEKGIDSKIRELAGGDLDKVSIELIAQAALEDDSLAYRVLQRSASYIGIGLANLVNLLNPKVVIFGGALFREIPQLIADPLRRIIKQRSLEKSANDVQLLVSTLGGESTALGAARLIAERIIEDLYLHWPSQAVEASQKPGPKQAKSGATAAAEDEVAVV
ncbi:MAG: ROK family transcriptional regulator [Terracidiphilus sp.]|jgi:predicted NBD/HSP70 family sugar kinase/DNA-binding CsgD family transcriptional regulator